MALMMFVPDENHMLTLGTELAVACSNDNTAVIFLYGNLGAGKTTLVRGFLRGLGYADKVKSPTYTLVESYQVKTGFVYHFDFYRLQNPVELEFIGVEDYIVPQAICLIEWPEQAGDRLPTPDLCCYIDFQLPGRHVRIEAHSVAGQAIMDLFKQGIA